MSKHSNFSSIVTYVIVVLLIMGLVGAVAYFTNGFTTDFTEFYVTMDGEGVLTKSVNNVFTPYSSVKIEAKYPLGVDDDEKAGYSYKIVANPERDFSFVVDGTSYSFNDESFDYYKLFRINRAETFFEITPIFNGLEEMIEILVPGADVIDVYGDIDTTNNLFLLTVYSGDKSNSVEIYFGVEWSISGIKLDQTEIYF